MSTIGDVLFELDDIMKAHGITYAIGGALALAFYARPRATSDIDLCVSTPQSSAKSLAFLLEGSGWKPVSTPSEAQSVPMAGTRFKRTDEPVYFDVFFSFDAYHRTLLSNAVSHRFRNGPISRNLPFVSRNDYVLLKLSFSRPQDWVDVKAVIDTGAALDVAYIERHLLSFRGPTFNRQVARLRFMMIAPTVFEKSGSGPHLTSSLSKPPEGPGMQCKAWMPIAGTQCVLVSGHAGHHRSRR